MGINAGNTKRSACCLAATTCGFVTSLVLCIWSVAMLRKYTPMYHPIVCVEENKNFTQPNTSGDLIVTEAQMKMRCTNRNNYAVELEESRVPGKVIVWPEEVVIGRVTVEREILPAHGDSLMKSDLRIEINGTTAMMLHAKGTTGVLLEMDVVGIAKLGVLVPGFRYNYNFETMQMCGFEIEAALSMRSGPAVCTVTREQLFDAGIPHIDDDPQSDFLIHLPEDTKRHARVLRDSILISLIVVTALISLVLFATLAQQSRKRLMTAVKDATGKESTMQNAADANTTARATASSVQGQVIVVDGLDVEAVSPAQCALGIDNEAKADSSCHDPEAADTREEDAKVCQTVLV